MNQTMTLSMLPERTWWEIRRAFYGFHRNPVLLVLLIQIPVTAFVYSKGAGLIYLDMLGVLSAIILASWVLTSAVHGNRKILVYSLLLLTIGTMLQCIFIKEAMIKNPDKYAGKDPAMQLQIQYLIGFAGAVLIAAIYHNWSRISSMRAVRILFAVSVLISLVTILFAASVGGVRNWIRIGGLSIQTTELTKLFYIFISAGLLGTTPVPGRERIRTYYILSAIMAAFLVIQSEYGTLLLLLLVFFAFLFLFVPETLVFLKTAGAFAGLVFVGVVSGREISKLAARYTFFQDNLLFKIILKGYGKIASRFIYWAHPEKDPLGLGYQLIKARESIVLGGWFGTASVTDLPVKTSDLVYPALIQRCGMVFALLVFLIFILMWLEGMRLFVRKADRYHQTVAAGLIIMLFVQATIIIAGSTGLCPLTGITLPFISSGGSSLLVSFVMVGLLITVSGNVRWKGEQDEEAEEFFKKGSAFAKSGNYLRGLHDAVAHTHLRSGAGSLRGGRPEKGQGKADSL